MTNERSIRVRHNTDENRYELYVGHELASVADYRVADDRAVFTHTYTNPQHRGSGLAARVVRAALDDVRERGLSVVPMCWFVAEFIDENPAYEPLLADEARTSA